MSPFGWKRAPETEVVLFVERIDTFHEMVKIKENAKNLLIGSGIAIAIVSILLAAAAVATRSISSQPGDPSSNAAHNPHLTSTSTSNHDIQPGNSTPKHQATSGVQSTQTKTPFPALTPTSTPEPTPAPDIIVDDLLREMNLEQKIGQMLLMGVDGQGITQGTCNLVNRLTPGGIVYRGNNADNPEQLAQFSNELQECSENGAGIPLFISIDHEGQYVTRFNSGATVFPAALAQGASGNPNNAYYVALAAGQELAFSGVNMVLGPVADVLTDFDNTVISQRSYGGNPQEVSQYVAEAVAGYIQAGIIPVLKHYPGHGGVPGDTHYLVVTDQVDKERFEQEYLPPFQSGIEAGAPAVMFGHVAYPSIDENVQPASLSSTMVQGLRDQLGFTGIAMTDSMGMGAITGSTGSVGEASVQAVLAGEDMLLVTSSATAQAAYDGVINAVASGLISEERINQAVRNLLKVKVEWGLISYPLAGGALPDWETNKKLSFDVGYDAVTLLRNNQSIIPLPQESRRILIIGPSDGWGLYNALSATLEQSGHTYQIYNYSNPWNGAIPETGYLTQLPSTASEYDITVVLTWESHTNQFRFGDTWQMEMVNRLLDEDVPLVVIALKSPTDILDFPEVETYFATYGTTPGQIQSLADSLVGKHNPTGINPLPGLP